MNRARVSALLAALVVSFWVSVVPASGHAQLTSSTPEDGAVLTAPPSVVTFVFDEPLLPGTDTISVNDASGNVIASQQAIASASSITAAWPAAASTGEFQVAYRVVSADGHPVTGAITITIDAAAAAAASRPPQEGDPASTGQPSANAIPPALVVAVAALLLGVVAVATIVIARRRGDETAPSPPPE